MDHSGLYDDTICIWYLNSNALYPTNEQQQSMHDPTSLSMYYIQYRKNVINSFSFTIFDIQLVSKKVEQCLMNC